MRLISRNRVLAHKRVMSTLKSDHIPVSHDPVIQIGQASLEITIPLQQLLSCKAMGLFVIVFAASVRWIHQNDIKLVIVRIVENVLRQGVVMHHLGRVNIMQKHIGDTEHVWELLFLDAID